MIEELKTKLGHFESICNKCHKENVHVNTMEDCMYCDVNNEMIHLENKIKKIEEELKVYPCQECQDKDINDDFQALHKDLVNMVIQFCIKHNITIDEFNLSADGLEESIKSGKWMPWTDSCFIFEKDNKKFLMSV